MCRWLAYSGEPLQPAALILDAKHSLVAQSLDSPLGAETVNGDGFGFGWYPTDPGPERMPGLFHSIEPAWNDQNLRYLTRAIESPLFFSHVRAAAGPPIQQTNCHPFRHQNWLFMHNGVLAGFRDVKRELTFAVDPSLYPDIQGTTDSEVLFHLALTFGLAEDPVKGMTKAVEMVEAVGRDHGVTFPMQGTVRGLRRRDAVGLPVLLAAPHADACSTPPTWTRCEQMYPHDGPSADLRAACTRRGLRTAQRPARRLPRGARVDGRDPRRLRVSPPAVPRGLSAPRATQRR